MTILIADDEEFNRLVLKKLLLPFGSIELARNGQEAYDAFVRNYEENHPYELVCLDIMMPVRDGLSTLREMRAFEEKKGIPTERRTKLVMTTALGDKEHVAEAIQGQCDAYFLKPYDRSKIVGKLRQLGLKI
jgi:two-component system chemotaxis response regulator CheY